AANQIIIQDRNYSIQIEDDILITKFSGPIKTSLFQEIHSKLVKIAEQYQINTWLLDQKEIMMHADACQWLKQEFVPKHQALIMQGKTAIVIADSFFIEHNLKKAIVEAFPEGTTAIAAFKRKEVALAWLKDQKSTQNFNPNEFFV
ncbi:MAG: hypothetical protein JJT94_02335, partial [Bernardetiaceae bacterium]|nr:hypothetical protein [Bernardetiaceae bacterium]